MSAIDDVRKHLGDAVVDAKIAQGWTVTVDEDGQYWWTPRGK